MTLIDFSALRAGLTFPLAHARLVAAGAALYAVPFAAQSLATAWAGASAPGATPLALGIALVAFGAFIFALSALGRAALGQTEPGSLTGLSSLGDAGRLGWVVVLILILVFTVIGTAFLALAFMLAALALINVDASAEPPEGFVDIFALFGPSEFALAWGLIAVFVAFSLWFGLRLAMAVPATLDARRVQVLTVWPLSGKRGLEIALTMIAAALPGVIALVVFNLASQALFGFFPASAQSASGEAGALSVAAIAVGLVSGVYGFGKMALVGAPATAALCALYVKFRSDLPVQPD